MSRLKRATVGCWMCLVACWLVAAPVFASPSETGFLVVAPDRGARGNVCDRHPSSYGCPHGLDPTDRSGIVDKGLAHPFTPGGFGAPSIVRGHTDRTARHQVAMSDSQRERSRR